MAPKRNGKKKPSTISPFKENNETSSSRSNNVVRLWTEKDETILLEALLQYHHQNQRLPDPNNYAQFLSSLEDPFSLSFQPDPSQLSNKLSVFQNFYRKQKKNPKSVKEGHNRLVYEMCHKLFGKGDDGAAANEDDGNYTNLLLLKDEAAMQFPRLSYMEDQEFIRLVGPLMARKYEDDLIEIKNSITELKMKEFSGILSSTGTRISVQNDSGLDDTILKLQKK